MLTSIPLYHKKMLIQGATGFLGLDSIDNLTFDVVMFPGHETEYPLGKKLHDIFTTDYILEDDQKVQSKIAETLEGHGVTYEVLVANTIRNRNDPTIVPKPKNPLTILPKAKIFTRQEQKDRDDDRKITQVEGRPKRKPKTPPASKKDEPVKPGKNGKKKSAKPSTKEAGVPNAPAKTPPIPIGISLDAARLKFVHWFRTSGGGGVSYALQNWSEFKDVDKKKVPEKIMVGNVAVDRKEFDLVVRVLQGQSELLGPKFAPAGKLKTSLAAVIKERQDLAARN